MYHIYVLSSHTDSFFLRKHTNSYLASLLTRLQIFSEHSHVLTVVLCMFHYFFALHIVCAFELLVMKCNTLISHLGVFYFFHNYFRFIQGLLNFLGFMESINCDGTTPNIRSQTQIVWVDDTRSAKSRVSARVYECP